jgi:hypothetical protein
VDCPQYVVTEIETISACLLVDDETGTVSQGVEVCRFRHVVEQMEWMEISQDGGVEFTCDEVSRSSSGSCDPCAPVVA